MSMAEHWAERSVADLVLRAWCPFLMNRGPVSQLDTTPTRGMPAVPPPLSQTVGDHVEPMSLGAVGLSLSQSLRTVICLGWGRELQGVATDSESEKTTYPFSSFGGDPGAALLIYREKGWPLLAERPPPFLLADRSVVFVAIDATRFLILLGVNSLPILFRQVAVILRTHTALFPVDTSFLVFQA
jgi:hypothetical protein